MKKIIIHPQILLLTTFLVFTITVASTNFEAFSQTKTIPNKATKSPVADSIIKDREPQIDLERLSRTATLHARGSVKNHPSNGLVVLEVGIDTSGRPYSFIPIEVSDDAFGPSAIEAVKIYHKRWKIKPAIKDGKPIDSPNTLIPIVFDMAIFDKK